MKTVQLFKPYKFSSSPILFSFSLLILVLPLYLSWTLLNIPQTDDPHLGKTKGFLCWERSFHDFTVQYQFSKILKNSDIPPYTPQGQIKVYELWLGKESPPGMASAYFPTFYLLMGILTALPVEFVFLLWNGTVAILWIKILLRIQNKQSPIKGAVITFVLLFSSTGITSFLFGQTALLFTALLILLNDNDNDKKSPETSSFPSQNSVFYSLRNYLFQLFRLYGPSSLMMLLLISKPPAAVIGGSILLSQKKFKEFFYSLIPIIFLTVIFCSQREGIQTAIDYFYWIQSYNLLSMPAPFINGFTTIFQTSFLGFTISQSLIPPDQIQTVNSLCILFISLGGMIFILKKNSDPQIIPLGIAWIYLLFSPYLSLTEDLIVGWIIVRWTQKYPKIWGWGIVWLVLILNTSQAYSVIAPSFFYLHPITWPLKLIGFTVWVALELKTLNEPDARDKSVKEWPIEPIQS